MHWEYCLASRDIECSNSTPKATAEQICTYGNRPLTRVWTWDRDFTLMGFHDRCTVALETTRRVGLSPSCRSWSSGSDSSSLISLSLSSPLPTCGSSSDRTCVLLFVSVPDFEVGFLDDDDKVVASFAVALLLLLLVEIVDVGFLVLDVGEAGLRANILRFEAPLLIRAVFAYEILIEKSEREWHVNAHVPLQSPCAS